MKMWQKISEMGNECLHMKPSLLKHKIKCSTWKYITTAIKKEITVEEIRKDAETKATA